jgi:hypothetical protein
MYSRLAVLFFCGSFALAASVCEAVAEAPHLEKLFPQKGSHLGLWDPPLPASRSFRLQVKAGCPSFLITVRSFVVKPTANQCARAGEIEVAHCRDGKRVQILPILDGMRRPILSGRAIRFPVNALD